MSDLPKSPARAKVQALALACLMMAAPAVAQEAATAPAANATSDVTGTAPAPVTAQEAAATAPATAAPVATAPAEAAPAVGAPVISGPTSTAPATPEAPAATTPAAATAPANDATAPAAPTAAAAPEATAPEAATTDAAAPQTATTEPAVVPATQPADAQPVEVVPAPFQPNPDSMLPESVQRALDPLLNPPARDPNLPHDLSPIGMFIAADIVVKIVMIGLAFASVVTWTVLVMKLLELWKASGNAARARRRIENAPDLPSAVAATGRRNDPASQMVRAAMAEYERSAPAFGRAGDEGTKDRVGSLLSQIEANASRRIGRGTGVLATIGSTAPFVGLFGTVWGIMNSFISISESQTTNLAVVAPGIAEALLATAIGLVAAIPAVVIYNVFARSITGYRLRLANASAGVQRLVSRDLDFRTEN